MEPASGWDLLLDHITSRKSEIEPGIDGRAVRRILERLATKARATAGGLGPLPLDFLIGAFSEICGYAPDERGLVLLQRLPGLAVDRDEEGSRAFIDEDFADACIAGDILRFIDSPFEFEANTIASIECAAGLLGVTIAAQQVSRHGFSAGKLNAAIHRARDVSPGSFTADLCRATIECGHPLEHSLHIRGVHVPELEFTAKTGNASRLEFQDCFFGRIGLDMDVDAGLLPKFKSCFIGFFSGKCDRSEGARIVRLPRRLPCAALSAG